MPPDPIPSGQQDPETSGAAASRAAGAPRFPTPEAAKGRVLRWRGGVYDVELPDAEAVKLLQVLLAHYAVPETTRPPSGRVTRLTVEVALQDAAAEAPRRTAETCRLFGLALARLCAGEAEGLVADETGERRVAWRFTAPTRRRAANRVRET